MIIASLVFIVVILVNPGLLDSSRHRNSLLGKSIGKVARLSGNVRVKNKTEIGWTYLGKDDPVFVGDRVFTDQESSVEIELDSVAKIELESEALVTLFEDEFQRAGLEVNQGLVQVATSSPQTTVSLRVEGEYLAIKGLDKNAKFQIKSRGDGLLPSRIQSQIGAFEIKKNNRVEKLKENETITNQKDEVATIQQLLETRKKEIDVHFADRDQVMLTSASEQDSNPNKNSEQRAELKTQETAQSIPENKPPTHYTTKPTSKNNKTDKPPSPPPTEIVTPVPVGEQTKQANSDGNNDELTQFAEMEIPAPNLVTPIDGVSIFFVKKENMSIKFEWEIVTAAQRYRIQIAKDPEFRFIIAEKETDQRFYEQTFQEPTRVYWRVQALNGPKESPWSSAFSVGLE